MQINDIIICDTSKEQVVLPKRTTYTLINKIKYLDLHCAFDIETTKGDKGSYMYHWQFGMKSEGTYYVYTGRTYKQLNKFLNKIIHRYKLHSKKRLYVWCHNLSYEMSFLKHRLEYDTTSDSEFKDYFLTDTRKWLKVIHKGCIEFRDSMRITNSSLNGLCKLYPEYIKYPKSKGDLDFDIIRNSKTELTGIELNYCYRDVLCLSDFDVAMHDKFIDRFKAIPLTQCGMVKTEMRRRIQQYVPYDAWQNIMRELNPTFEEYIYFRRYLFRGGWCGSALKHTGHTLDFELFGVDETSAYPYVMLTKKFPMSKFIESDIKDLDTLKKYPHYIVDITLNNIRSKIGCDYISLSQCIEQSGYIQANGKIKVANSVRILATELDLDIINKCYDIGSTHIHTSWYCEKSDHLPQPLVDNLLHFYRGKQELKDEGLSYGYEKQMTNINYGAMVQKVNADDITINSSGEVVKGVKEGYYDEFLDNCMLSQMHGIYITAWARYALFELITRSYAEPSGGNVYSDTDSCKLPNTTRNKLIVKHLNNKRRLEVQKALDYYNVPRIYHKYYLDLGQWDIEYKLIPEGMFLTLGAKRYLLTGYQKVDYKNICFTKLHSEVTVAGLPKGVVEEYCNLNHLDIFDYMCNNDVAILDCKTTTEYIDEPVEEVITDSTGYSEKMQELSCVNLNDIDFTLIISEEYRKLWSLLN